MRLFALLVVVIPCFGLETDLWKPKPQPTPFHDWDYLVYSQRWTITGCEEWEDRSPTNRCNLPRDPSIWAVHGVWPTKIGADGPFFCPSAIHFDPDQLTPMMDQLQDRWPNIEANTKPNSFWKHEWDKHGTCASTLPQLNSITNFFQRGLQWNQRYKLADMLANKQIVPNENGYDIHSIYGAIQSAVGRNPIVQCVVDGKTKKSLINEIRICFNKTLDLIDCNVADLDDSFYQGDILSNCNLKEAVMYYETVPGPNRYHGDLQQIREHYFRTQRLFSAFKLVRFLFWWTL